MHQALQMHPHRKLSEAFQRCFSIKKVMLMKIFTLTTRNSRIVMMLLSFILAGAFSLSAEEYKSMIRYDRVWECLNLEGEAPYLQTYIKCMKFDGTEDINGKTYHRLVTFKKSIKSGEGYVVQDDVLEHEGYLREENGIVYTLVEGDGSSYSPNIGEWFGGRYVPHANSQSTNGVNEYILYNFNVEEDGYYDGMTYVCDYAKMCKFIIISENSVEIDGESCRSIEVASIDPYDVGLMPSHTYIEGIGAGEYGCLTHHEYDDQRTGMWMRNYINRVFDMEGNVIFSCLDGCLYEDLQYGSFSATDGVKAVEASTETATSIYDVLGRRITDPAPGQLYIRNGKKFIGK